jgi:hypothetical protein
MYGCGDAPTWPEVAMAATIFVPMLIFVLVLTWMAWKD